MGGAPPPPLGVAPQGPKNRKNSTVFGRILEVFGAEDQRPEWGGEGGDGHYPIAGSSEGGQSPADD